MTPYLSDKIRLLSFFSIIMVLFIHSSFQETAECIQGMSFNINLQYFISQMLCRCAVPLFFCISGYLFFLHTESGIKAVLVKMRKRFGTLVIPFIVSIIFFLLSFVAINGFLIGGTDEIYEFSFTANSFPKIVYALTADSGTGYP
ncbi:MAG: acyltransferase family protein, partial [Bacteroidaceae bacterium]